MESDRFCLSQTILCLYPLKGTVLILICLVLIIGQLRVAKNVQRAALEWDQIPEPVNQQHIPSPNAYERLGVEAAEEVSGVEDDGKFFRRQTLQ